MVLKDTIHTEMVAALKKHDELTVRTLRSVLGAITEQETSGKERHTITDSDVLNVIRKQIKMREDAFETYSQAGATDRADAEKAESDVLSVYLPKMLDADETRTLIQGMVTEMHLENAGPRGIGRIMGALKAHDDVDKGLAAKIAKEMLNA